ncbi:hypothetical protein HDU98_009642 [Podochytrium sp. JEL0797]|nr:hypothetical protein HDU98_009642 [Podochytrium sp. JEL0797]
MTIANKSKIFCTIGPKTQSVEMLTKLYDAGMTVARLNFSHGTHEYHAATIVNIRKMIKESKTEKTLAIMLDTKGPEIRTGKLVGGTDKALKMGQHFVFHSDISRIGDENATYMTYDELVDTVKVGGTILVDDGLIGCTVLEINKAKKEVLVRVENNGMLGENKGINLPEVSVQLPAITEKDAGDLRFGVQQGVDLIAASFIRKASDVHEIRKIVGNKIKIISKIESQEGLDNFDEILEASDGIMAARGDLGVEVPVECVARYQKMMITKCNAVGKPIVTATQMLESMIVNPRPTRAEATDVANAILQGSDAVMLSGETAKGAFPINAVSTMSAICREAELDINYPEMYRAIRANTVIPQSISEAVAASAVKTSNNLEAAMIVVLTESGTSAQTVCKYRPICPILAITTDPQVARQCQILRGVYPKAVASMANTEQVIAEAVAHGIANGMCKKGDAIVVTSGILANVHGNTNIMRVVRA